MRKTILSFLFATILFTPAMAQGAEIIVSAAASLTNAFTEMKTAFERAHPAIAVVTNFAASTPLLKQMEEGAPVDVFASADQITMDQAAEKTLIDPASRVNFALNSLVLITPSDNPANIAAVSDLNKKEVQRITIGNPDSVPAGRYAREALTNAKLWDGLFGKFVFGDSVRQCLDYVSRGEVQAGFVYNTDALQGGGKVKVAAVAEGHSPVSYPIAVTKHTKNPDAAAAFVRFVASPEGRTVLAKYGFSPAQ